MFCCSACGVGCASGWGDSVVQVLTYTLCYFALLFIAKFKFTPITVSIAIGAVDLDDRMVFH